MTYLYMYIPGMAHEVQLSESADRIPDMGDRLEIDAARLDKSSRNLLETTPACHCFERNAETERQTNRKIRSTAQCLKPGGGKRMMSEDVVPIKLLPSIVKGFTKWYNNERRL